MDLETLDTYLGVVSAAWLIFMAVSRWGISMVAQALWLANLLMAAAYLLLSPLVWFGIELAIKGYAALSGIIIVEAATIITFGVAGAGEYVLVVLGAMCMTASIAVLHRFWEERRKAVHPLDLPVYG